jgi:Na+-driven multidrug efflux pump
VSGILLIPFVLARVRTDTYGVWLAFGEVLAYSSMVDLGVVGVVPWLVAENDGRGDRAAIRGVMAAAVLFSSAAAALFLALAVGALSLVPSLARLPAALAADARGPLLMVAVLMAVGMPLRSFSAALIGLQDATFAGFLGVAQLALSVTLTVGLLLAGGGCTPWPRPPPCPAWWRRSPAWSGCARWRRTCCAAGASHARHPADGEHPGVGLVDGRPGVADGFRPATAW